MKKLFMSPTVLTEELMRALKLALFASLLTFGLASVAHGIALPQSQLLQLDLTSSGNIYTEVGDAGDRLNPQSITGSNINQIVGNIGGVNDPTDAFKFFFAGGDIQFIGAAFHDSLVAIPLPLDLFNAAFPPDPITPTSSDVGSITFLGLLAGNYIIEANFAVDPPFSIGILNPTTGGPQSISAPVPEPGSLALVLAGLVGLWSVRRWLWKS
jgi:hypothetical protein